MNLGYNGSKGNHLDITSECRRQRPAAPLRIRPIIFNYEQAAYSNFNAGTVRVNKHSRGIARSELSIFALDRQSRARRRHFNRGGAELA